ncbi:unnamed protein product [Soboliphyme baturini]|uniref:Very-long-chain 3-oxoacyl-CoA synthase n=1 Tax=Soboliphyme baturini TaxID=241478 RepID=A0A183IFI2_9BILA|nr:unnamed protein product [Soboliphyme baturini]
MVYYCLEKVFPPLNSVTLLRHYIPLCGAVSHSMFSIHILNPELLTKIFAMNDAAISNALFLNANLGIAVYMYYAKHMKRVTTSARVIYSVFTTILFNFGSVLFWATAKAVLPKNGAARMLFGVFTSFCFLAVGKDYCMYINSLSSPPPSDAE